MFIEGREKRGQKREWENSAWFLDREDNVGNWWKNLMNHIRMINSKGRVRNIETETIRRKIENKSRDEVNEGTIQESDNTADIHDENADTNHVDEAN